MILGVPRGAIPMARIIADALGGEFDVALVRKRRAPGQPDLAIGAVDEAGTVLKGRYFDVAHEEAVAVHLQSLGREAVLVGDAACDAVRFMRTVEHETIRRTLAKTDASPVTVADFVVQAFLASRQRSWFTNREAQQAETT